MGEHRGFWGAAGVLVLVTGGLIAWASVAGTGADRILEKFLPGKFGAGFDPAMTGNLLFAALILCADSVVLLVLGLGTLCNAARKTLLIAPQDLERLLRRAAGLSREDIAATHFAVAEEQKAEMDALRHGRAVTLVGGALLAMAFVAVCYSWARADAGGAMLAGAGGNLPNGSLTPKAVLLFAGNQLANALLLDAPLVLRWQLSSLWAGDTLLWFKPFVLAFHVLAKLAVFAVLLGWWRLAHLRACLLARTETTVGLRTMESATALPALQAAPQPAADKGPLAFRDTGSGPQFLAEPEAQPPAGEFPAGPGAPDIAAEPSHIGATETAAAPSEDGDLAASVPNIPAPPIGPQEWRSLH